jgi:transcriptional regulator with XRE-family HTH domain
MIRQPKKERRRKRERLGQYRSRAYRDLQARLSVNILRLREQSDLTQEEAAHRCGMATRLFVSVEHGEANATLTTLARLCKGLRVDIEALMRRRPVNSGEDSPE